MQQLNIMIPFLRFIIDTQYAPLALYNKINLLIEKNEAEALTETQKFISRYPQHPNFSDVEKIKNNLDSKFSANP
jgi:hypothetical protein